MASRADYNACMRPYIIGSKPKEQRRIDFCIGAKICSRKAKDVEEARAICSQPKPPKEAKARRPREGQSCEKNAFQVAECVVIRLTENNIYREQALNINSVGAAVSNALIDCQCQKQ